METRDGDHEVRCIRISEGVGMRYRPCLDKPLKIAS